MPHSKNSIRGARSKACPYPAQGSSLPRLSSLSAFLPNQAFMSFTEIKGTKLPSGYRFGDSWGALRRAWRGFKISHSEGDQGKMKEYAKVIRKLQYQMGLETNDFDPYILDEVEDLQIRSACYLGHYSNETAHASIRQVPSEGEEIEQELNYEDSLKDLNVTPSIFTPRTELFEGNGMRRPDTSVAENVDEIVSSTEHYAENTSSSENFDALDSFDPLETYERSSHNEDTDESSRHVIREGRSCGFVDTRAIEDSPPVLHHKKSCEFIQSEYADHEEDKKFQPASEMNSTYTIHKDRSCSFQELSKTQKRKKSCPYKPDSQI